MTARAFFVAGGLALAGTLGSAARADAQWVAGVWYGSPYRAGWPYPGAYSVPMYGYWGHPYWSSPLRGVYGNPYWGGYPVPSWYGGPYGYPSAYYGVRYQSFYYVTPWYGSGYHAYRWGW